MKVVILAGGLGTRISELTKVIPKPMIKIVGKPIIHRIVDHFISYGFKEFYIALGYKGNLIKQYFQKCKFRKDIKINCIFTGKKTMTGGRIKKLDKYLDKTFIATYGDGLSSVNISKLVKFHKKKKKLVTVTAVRPPARFGAIKITKDIVEYFREKSSLDEGWINGGFFVMEPKFLTYIKNDNTFLEKEPLERAGKNGELLAFKHNDFWQCMDTKRDKDNLEKILRNKNRT